MCQPCRRINSADEKKPAPKSRFFIGGCLITSWLPCRPCQPERPGQQQPGQRPERPCQTCPTCQPERREQQPGRQPGPGQRREQQPERLLFCHKRQRPERSGQQRGETCSFFVPIDKRENISGQRRRKPVRYSSKKTAGWRNYCASPQYGPGWCLCFGAVLGGAILKRHGRALVCTDEIIDRWPGCMTIGRASVGAAKRT